MVSSVDERSEWRRRCRNSKKLSVHLSLLKAHGNPAFLLGFFVLYLKHHTFVLMEKGKKRVDLRYFLEIKDLNYNPVYLASGVSLREAVRLVAEHVTDMDHHSKVYRELREMNGAYVGLFYAPQGAKKPIHVFVLIREYINSSPSEDLEALAQIEQA